MVCYIILGSAARKAAFFMKNDYSTKKISKKMISELVTSIKSIKGWGTVEIIIQDHLVTQITEKNIRKPLLSERSSKSL